MKNKMIDFIKKFIKETNRTLLIISGSMILFGIVIGFLFGFGYFLAMVAFCLIFFFIKKVENDDLTRAEQTKRMEENQVLHQEIKEEIEKLEKRAEIIREHIEQTNDLDSKLKLVEVEEEIKNLQSELQG